MLYVYTIVLIIVMILPAVVIIPQAFTSLNYFKFPVEETSFKWFEKFFDNEQWVVGLGRSMMIAVLAAVLATVIGTMGALAMNKLNFKGKSVFMSIMIAPMVVPVVVVGAALYTTFAPIGLTNSIPGLVFAHTLLGIPMVFVTMLSGFANVNENLELAAMSMGSSPVGAFFKVTLPTVKTSVVSSVLFAFVTSLDEVVVTTFVPICDQNRQTMPLQCEMPAAVFVLTFSDIK